MDPARRSISNGICELVLETRDLDRLTAFYEVLGLPVLSREDDRVWLAAGDRARLGLWCPGDKEHDDRGGRHVHFALSVGGEALDLTADRLRDRGLELEGPIEHDGGDRSLYFFDPDGNRVEFWDYFEAGDDVAGLAD